jgi:two-component system, OmpR family, sensor kinase
MSSRRRSRSVDASLFVQVLGLLIGGLIATQLIILFVYTNLPPPSPDAYSAREIGRAFMGMPPPQGRAALHVTDERRPFAQTQELGEYEIGLRQSIADNIVERGGPRIDPERVVIHSSAQRWYRDRIGRLSFNDLVRASESFAAKQFYTVAPFKIAIPLPNGKWRYVRSPRKLGFDPWQQRAFLTFAVTTLVIVAAAYLFSRRLTWPFSQLAEGAERLGRDPRAPPLQIAGAAEARVAARAFNDMQERLRRYVEDRTAMVGAIAHDLRTPLTRLRFRIESTPDDLRAKLSSDLDEMEAMISATLSFVRDANQAAERTKLELSSLLESLVDEMQDTKSDVVIERAERVVIEGDPIALKRLFSNLLDNAVKYGSRARVRVFAQGRSAIVEVDDDGPGVPKAELERVFEPFYRREPSRNRETGGIGLGLAVVRSVARAHGGDAELENRQGGGLTARVTLPA